MVAINVFDGDSEQELEAVRRSRWSSAPTLWNANDAFERGGEGAAALAEAVADAAEQPNGFTPTYSLEAPIQQKIEAIATRIYGAAEVDFLQPAEESIARFTEDGLGGLPVCMAKTHLSLSDDPTLLNAPEGFTLQVRNVRAYTGAGWLVPLCGEVMTMPGLGERAAAFEVDIDPDGRTVGLF